MLTSPASLFTKSLLAAAVLAATGCASTAPGRTDDTGFSGPLVDASRATAGFTARALSRTGYLLGLHDGGQRADDAPPLDEVDLAMMEEDAVMPWDERSITLAGIERIDAMPEPAARPIAQAGSEALLDNGAAGSLGVDDALVEQAGVAVARFVEDEQATMAVEPTMDVEPMVDIVAFSDYTHTVGADENLWAIAKATTGDATNWHALADVNDLGQDAAVYPGQALIIPADMLRPELVMAEPDATPGMPDVAPLAQAPLADPLLDIAPAPNDATDTVDAPVAAAFMNPSEDARGFVVEPGETLWEFARRTTGDATEWQTIAAHNGFDEQRARTIRQGEQIFVPDTLVRAELSLAAAAGNDAGVDLDRGLDRDVGRDATDVAADGTGVGQADRAPDTDRVSPRMIPIAEASAALPAEPALPATANAGLDETRDLTIVEATYREPEPELLVPSSPDAPAEIMISGTYYPKAVYNEADFSSSLLMRVSPGTRLPVASVDGAWYTVQTEDGVGYVHDRDVK